jgi:gliding motility-associated-like protein
MKKRMIFRTSNLRKLFAAVAGTLLSVSLAFGQQVTPFPVSDEAGLREAIDTINSPTAGVISYLITIDSPIAIMSVLPSIQKSGTFTSTTGGTLTVDGNFRHIVTNSADLTINNLVLVGNASSGGGGVWVDGDLTISRTEVKECVNIATTFDSRYAPIYASGTIDVDNSYFYKNQNIVSLSGVVAYGGAITGEGDVNVSTSTFEENLASSSNANADGGAIYSGGSLTVKNSTFFANQANAPNGQTIIYGSNAVIAENVTVVHQGYNAFGAPMAGNISVSNSIIIAQDHSNYSSGNLSDVSVPGDLFDTGTPSGYGGFAPTIKIKAGGLAHDKITPSLSDDQRGVPRPQGSQGDYGAYEILYVDIALNDSICSGALVDASVVAPLNSDLPLNSEYVWVATNENNQVINVTPATGSTAATVTAPTVTGTDTDTIKLTLKVRDITNNQIFGDTTIKRVVLPNPTIYIENFKDTVRSCNSRDTFKVGVTAGCQLYEPVEVGLLIDPAVASYITLQYSDIFDNGTWKPLPTENFSGTASVPIPQLASTSTSFTIMGNNQTNEIKEVPFTLFIASGTDTLASYSRTMKVFPSSKVWPVSSTDKNTAFSESELKCDSTEFDLRIKNYCNVGENVYLKLAINNYVAAADSFDLYYYNGSAWQSVEDDLDFSAGSWYYNGFPLDESITDTTVKFRLVNKNKTGSSVDFIYEYALAPESDVAFINSAYSSSDTITLYSLAYIADVSAVPTDTICGPELFTVDVYTGSCDEAKIVKLKVGDYAAKSEFFRLEYSLDGGSSYWDATPHFNANGVFEGAASTFSGSTSTVNIPFRITSTNSSSVSETVTYTISIVNAATPTIVYDTYEGAATFSPQPKIEVTFDPSSSLGNLNDTLRCGSATLTLSVEEQGCTYTFSDKFLLKIEGNYEDELKYLEMEYDEGGTWYPLPDISGGEVIIGPPGGFPGDVINSSAATVALRLTNKNNSGQTVNVHYKLSLIGADSTVVYSRLRDSIVVLPTATVTTMLDSTTVICANDTLPFSVTATNNCGGSEYQYLALKVTNWSAASGTFELLYPESSSWLPTSSLFNSDGILYGWHDAIENPSDTLDFQLVNTNAGTATVIVNYELYVVTDDLASLIAIGDTTKGTFKLMPLPKIGLPGLPTSIECDFSPFSVGVTMGCREGEDSKIRLTLDDTTNIILGYKNADWHVLPWSAFSFAAGSYTFVGPLDPFTGNTSLDFRVRSASTAAATVTYKLELINEDGTVSYADTSGTIAVAPTPYISGISYTDYNGSWGSSNSFSALPAELQCITDTLGIEIDVKPGACPAYLQAHLLNPDDLNLLLLEYQETPGTGPWYPANTFFDNDGIFVGKAGTFSAPITVPLRVTNRNYGEDTLTVYYTISMVSTNDSLPYFTSPVDSIRLLPTKQAATLTLAVKDTIICSGAGFALDTNKLLTTHGDSVSFWVVGNHPSYSATYSHGDILTNVVDTIQVVVYTENTVENCPSVGRTDTITVNPLNLKISAPTGEIYCEGLAFDVFRQVDVTPNNITGIDTTVWWSANYSSVYPFSLTTPDINEIQSPYTYTMPSSGTTTYIIIQVKREACFHEVRFGVQSVKAPKIKVPDAMPSILCEGTMFPQFNPTSVDTDFVVDGEYGATVTITYEEISGTPINYPFPISQDTTFVIRGTYADASQCSDTVHVSVQMMPKPKIGRITGNSANAGIRTNQTVCQFVAITTPIKFALSGAIDSVDIPDLPAGMTYTVNATGDTLTISGAPTADPLGGQQATYTFYVYARPVSPCTVPDVDSVTIKVNPAPKLDALSADTLLCGPTIQEFYFSYEKYVNSCYNNASRIKIVLDNPDQRSLFTLYGSASSYNASSYDITFPFGVDGVMLNTVNTNRIQGTVTNDTIHFWIENTNHTTTLQMVPYTLYLVPTGNSTTTRSKYSDTLYIQPLPGIKLDGANIDGSSNGLDTLKCSSEAFDIVAADMCTAGVAKVAVLTVAEADTSSFKLSYTGPNAAFDISPAHWAPAPDSLRLIGYGDVFTDSIMKAGFVITNTNTGDYPDTVRYTLSIRDSANTAIIYHSVEDSLIILPLPNIRIEGSDGINGSGDGLDTLKCDEAQFVLHAVDACAQGDKYAVLTVAKADTAYFDLIWNSVLFGDVDVKGSLSQSGDSLLLYSLGNTFNFDPMTPASFTIRNSNDSTTKRTVGYQLSIRDSLTDHVLYGIVDSLVILPNKAIQLLNSPVINGTAKDGIVDTLKCGVEGFTLQAVNACDTGAKVMGITLYDVDTASLPFLLEYNDGSWKDATPYMIENSGSSGLGTYTLYNLDNVFTDEAASSTFRITNTNSGTATEVVKYDLFIADATDAQIDYTAKTVSASPLYTSSSDSIVILPQPQIWIDWASTYYVKDTVACDDAYFTITGLSGCSQDTAKRIKLKLDDQNDLQWFDLYFYSNNPQAYAPAAPHFDNNGVLLSDPTLPITGPWGASSFYVVNKNYEDVRKVVKYTLSLVDASDPSVDPYPTAVVEDSIIFIPLPVVETRDTTVCINDTINLIDLTKKAVSYDIISVESNKMMSTLDTAYVRINNTPATITGSNISHYINDNIDNPLSSTAPVDTIVVTLTDQNTACTAFDTIFVTRWRLPSATLQVQSGYVGPADTVAVCPDARVDLVFTVWNGDSQQYPVSLIYEDGSGAQDTLMFNYLPALPQDTTVYVSLYASQDSSYKLVSIVDNFSCLKTYGSSYTAGVDSVFIKVVPPPDIVLFEKGGNHTTDTLPSALCKGQTIELDNIALGMAGDTVFLAPGIWSSGDTAVASVTLAGEVTAKNPGLAEIIYRTTTATGCPVVGSWVFNVNEVPNIAIAALTGSSPICDTDTLSLAATESGVHYLLYKAGSPDTLIQTVYGNGNARQFVLSGSTASGSYFVEAIPNDGKCYNERYFTDTVNVLIYNSPAASTITPLSPVTFCDGGSVILEATFTPTQDTIQWYRDGLPVSGTEGAYTATESGVYTAIVVDTLHNSCVSAPSNAITVTVEPVPAQPIVTNPVLACADAPLSNTEMIATIQYNSVSDTLTWFDGNGTPLSPFVPYTVSGTYTYKVVQTDTTTTWGCTSDTASFTYVIYDNPVVEPKNDTICYNQPYNLLSLVPGATPSTDTVYTFTDNWGEEITGNDTNSYWVILQDSRTYTITVDEIHVESTASITCSTTLSDTAKLAVLPLPSAPVLKDTAVCQYSASWTAASLPASTNTEYELVWYYASGSSATIDTATVLAEINAALSATISAPDTILSYQVAYKRLQDPKCEGVLKATWKVTIVKQPLAPSVALGYKLDYATCAGSPAPALPVSLDPNYELTWYEDENSTAKIDTNSIILSSDTTFVVRLKMKNAPYCESEASTYTYKVYALPEITVRDTAICYNEPFDLMKLVKDVSSSYTYTFDDGNGQLITSGSYVVTLQNTATYTVIAEEVHIDAAGTTVCSKSATVTVTVQPLPSAPVLKDTAVCQYSASWTAVPASQDNNYELVWYNMNDTPVSGGTGTVLAEINAAITATISASDTVLSYKVANKMKAHPYCEGTEKTTWKVTIVKQPDSPQALGYTLAYAACEGSTPPPALPVSLDPSYDLLWYVVGGPGPVAPPILSTAPGSGATYEVSLKSKVAPFCESTKSTYTYVVRANPTLLANDTTICYDKEVDLASLITQSADINLPLQYFTTVVPVEELPSSVVSYIQQSVTYTIVASRSYTGPAGTCSVSEEVRINVNPLPDMPVVTPLTVCQGASSLSLPQPQPDHEYVWYDASGAATTTPDLDVLAAATGTYHYKIANKNEATECESWPLVDWYFIVNPKPAQPTLGLSGAATFCEGGSVTLSVTSTVTSGDRFQWFRDGSAIGTPTSESTYTVYGSGEYSVQVTNTFGCISDASAAQTVTVYPLPSIPQVLPSGPIAFCEGNSILLTAVSTISVGSITYQWFNSSGSITGATNSMYETPLLQASETYTVVAISASGCSSTAPSGQLVVTVYPKPDSVTISTSDPIAFCEGGKALLTASSVPSGHTVLWFKDGIQIAGATASTYEATISGNYTVAVESPAPQLCVSEQSAPWSITVNERPDKPVIMPAGQLSICEGSTVTLNAVTSNSISIAGYQWYRNGEDIGFYTASWFAATLSGSYTVQAISTVGNCASTASEQVVVLVVPRPAIPVIAGPSPLSIRQGDRLELELENPESVSYQWYHNNNVLAGEIGVSLTVNDLQFYNAGMYTIRAYVLADCESVSLPVELIVLDDIVVPNVLTPNGDGKNDTFVIEGLDTYLEDEIVIVTRWGNQVFNMKNYDGSFTGEGLDDGVYFYSLRLIDQNGQKSVKTGYITLRRSK